ncbi:MAG: SoxR reducing system RseC family protein [Acidaminobacteraceae bacterium]
MNKTGIIVRINKNRAIVQIDKTGECGDKCEGCSAACNVPHIEVELENTLNASIGDYVNIVAKQSTLISSSFILYTIPLLAFIVGIFAGVKISDYYMFADSELIAITSGFLFLVLSYLIISLITKNMKELIQMESKLERFDI